MNPAFIEAGTLALIALALAWVLAKNPPPPGNGTDPWGYQ